MMSYDTFVVNDKRWSVTSRVGRGELGWFRSNSEDKLDQVGSMVGVCKAGGRGELGRG